MVQDFFFYIYISPYMLSIYRVILSIYIEIEIKRLPCSSGGKESTCNAGDLGSIPRWEDILEGKWLPTPVLLPGASNGQRSLTDYGPWGCKELDTNEVP